MTRVIDVNFWTDEKVVELFSPEDKLFFLYLMTNPHTTQLGIYGVSRKIMSFEIGYSMDVINVLIDRFENKYKVICTSKTTNEIAILNYLKHSIIKGGKPVEDLLKREIGEVKDKKLLAKLYENLSKVSNLNKSVEIILKYINTMLSGSNDNENDNDESYHDSYYDSYHDSSDINRTSAAYNGIKAHDAIGSMIEKFNGIEGLAKYKKPSINDELAVDRILQEFSETEITETFDKVAKSDFLRGANNNGWKATFDWLIKLDNFKKVFNGNYDNRKGTDKGGFKPKDINGQYDNFEAEVVTAL